jgi:hypothetical protein
VKETKLTGDIKQFVSPVNQRYTGDLVVYFKDDTQTTFETSGTYNGIYVARFNVSTNAVKLKKGEKCPELTLL